MVFDRVARLEHVAARGDGAYLQPERRDLTAQPSEVHPEGRVRRLAVRPGPSHELVGGDNLAESSDERARERVPNRRERDPSASENQPAVALGDRTYCVPGGTRTIIGSPSAPCFWAP